MKPLAVLAQSGADTPNTPIAILGASCRLPGGAVDLDSYWKLLESGVDAVVDVPRDRFEMDAFFSEDPDAPGRSYARRAGFLHDIRSFDPSFFGIADREAEAMDPQQRLVLEVVLEALESAGLKLSMLRGSNTGVIVGTSGNDYPLVRAENSNVTDGFTAAGLHAAVLANRVAHVFDLHGPNFTVDTACAASLTALHLGAASLRRRECNLIIVAGVNLIEHPFPFISLSKGRMLSPTGKARVFDRGADGYVRGEGCGAVVLAGLDDALKMGLPILGVLRGSAIGQDGYTSGISAPNGHAQELLYRRALDEAGLAPSQITLVEAHGTGTRVGDLTELRSLSTVYGEGDRRCWLGSVKANIGHLEGAAGMAGLLKVLLCLRHGQVPRQVHFHELPEGSGIERSRIAISTEVAAWEGGANKRIAAISAFGFGGALAHAIVEEAPPRPASPPAFSGGPLLFSAHTPQALRARAKELSSWLRQTTLPSADIAYTAGVCRDALRYRGAVVGADAAGWAEALDLFHAHPPEPTPLGEGIVFVYAGQGPQWWAMGRELLQTDVVFRAAIERCDTILRDLGAGSVLDALMKSEEESQLSETWFAQPALFAVQVALTERLAAWGVRPHAVVGHSLGEIAACWAAGALTLEQAARVIHYRVQMQSTTDGGRMATAQLAHEEADALVAPYGERLVVAAYNGPDEVALSGYEAELQHALDVLATREVHTRRMRVRYAFHSPQMEASSRKLARDLNGLEAAAPRLPIFSSVRGGPAEPGDFGGAYHARNVREPVRFAQAVAAMVETGYRTFVEISPHPVLGGYVEAVLRAAGARGLVLSTLRRQQPEVPALHQTFASLWQAGYELDPALIIPEARLCELPAATMLRREYSFSIRANSAASNERPSAHPCIRMPARSSNPNGSVHYSFSIHVEPAGFYQLQDHRVRGRVVLPGAAVIDLALSAAHHGLGRVYALEDLELIEPVNLSAEAGQALTLSMTPAPGQTSSASPVFLFHLAAPEGDEFRVHARGRLRPSVPEAPAIDIAAIRARCTRPVDEQRHVDAMEAAGLSYGPAFRPLSSIAVGEGEAYAELVASSIVAAEALRCDVHPGLLDGAFQILALTGASQQYETWLPVGLSAIEKFGPLPEKLFCWVREQPAQREDERCAEILLSTLQGEVRLSVSGFRVRRVGAEQTDYLNALVGISWTELQQPVPEETLGRWGLYVDANRVDDGLSNAVEVLRAALLKRGAAVTIASAPDELPGDLEGLLYLPALRSESTEGDQEQARVLLPALELCKVLSTWKQPPALWFITRRSQAVGLEPGSPIDPTGAALFGLARTVQAEMPSMRCVVADLGGSEPEVLQRLVQRLTPHTEEGQLALRGDILLGARLTSLPPPVPVPRLSAGGRFQLFADGSHRLNGLHFHEQHPGTLPPDEIEIAVRVAGLNFIDVMMALGMLSGLEERTERGISLGWEVAGEVVAVGSGVTSLRVGDRVMGVLPGSFASHVRARPETVYRVPPALSFAEAATIPLAFATAWRSLVTCARLQRGERVLIHAGAGGVGMAAIQIAQYLGAEVYATAGSPVKRDLLLSMGVRAAFDSRSRSFVEGVLSHTRGEGVDVVLNSLAEPLLSASLEVLRRDGRFVDIGKRDYLANTAVGLRPFLKRLTFSLVDLLSELRERPEFASVLIHEFAHLFDSGHLRPLPATPFAMSAAAEAFGAMARSQLTGKLVLIPDAAPQVLPALGTSADASVLVTGGLGGLGLQVARWLAAHGSPRLWLLGRRAPGEAQRQAIAELTARGARVEIVQGDVADPQSLDAVLQKIRLEGPPLRGVVHAAGVVIDRTLGALDADVTRAQFRPKVTGAYNLHRALRNDRLDFFVLFSSVAGLIGSPGQSAYAACNSCLDALAELRRSQGLPALSIAWGAWSEVGMAADLALLERMIADGILPIDPRRGAQTFGRLLQAAPAVVGVLPAAWDRWTRRNQTRARLPFFEAVAVADQAASSEGDAREIAAVPAGERAAWLLERLREQVAAVLRVAIARVEPAVPITALGFDSLMSVELRTRIETAFGVNVPLATLLRVGSLMELSEHLLSMLQPRLASRPGPTGREAQQAATDSGPGSRTAPPSPVGVIAVPPPLTAPPPPAPPPSAEPSVSLRAAPPLEAAGATEVMIDPEHAYDPFPQTYMQRAYKIGEQEGIPLGGISYAYYAEFEKDDQDLDRLAWAWNRIVQRHPMLRCILTNDGQAQVLREVPPASFTVHDLRHLGEGSALQRAALDELRARLSQLRFDTSRYPLFALEAARLSERRTRIYFTVALNTCDAMSLRTAAYEWCKLALHGDELPPLSLTFRDYQLAVLQKEQSSEWEQARSFWMEKLDRIPPAPALPLAQPLYAVPADAPRKRHEMRLDPQGFERFCAHAASAGVTPSVAICAAFSDVLAAWSESSHFTLNLTAFGRAPIHPEVGLLVGELVSTTLLEVRHDGQTFIARAQSLRDQLMENLEHQLFPGVQVLAEMAKRGTIVLMPVVFTSLLVHRPPADEGAVGRAALGELIYTATRTPQVLLDHIVFEDEGAVVLSWDVIEGAFPPGLIDAMFGAYSALIQRLSEDRSAWVATRRRLVPTEQQALRTSTTVPIPNLLLHDLVLQRAAIHPERVAVISGDTQLGFGELVARAAGVAHALYAYGLRDPEPVAIWMPKGPQQVVATLGVLMAGGIVLPLDAEAPAARNQQLVSLAGARIILCTQAGRVAGEADQVVVDVDALGTGPLTGPWPVRTPEEPAYLIYTSGSSGVPKGVLLHHRGFVNVMTETNERLGITAHDAAIGVTGLHHDLSIYDIFGILAAGGRLVLPEADRRRDPAHWLELIERHGVTFWNSVPALMEMLLVFVEKGLQPGSSSAVAHGAVAALRSLRLVSLGGDWLPRSHPNRLRALVPSVAMISIGGPTETSIWNIWHPIGELDPSWPSIPYGKPTPNARYYILDDQLEERPDWVPGTMWCAGAGLAIGYHRDEARTREAFRIHPDTGERIYNTGDRGRYRPGGVIEFLGRADLQVKIRGVRIELAECESVLEQHPLVRQVAVVVQGSPQHGERSLVAFVAPTTELMLVTREASELKLKRRGLHRFESTARAIGLPSAVTGAPIRRASQRTFTRDPVAWTDLAALLEELRSELPQDGKSPRYRYPSAGGIYPVQTYVHARRVEGLSPGTYYYESEGHRLIEIEPGEHSNAGWQAPHNRAIAEEAAFSLVLVADLEAIEPQYGGLAIELCLLEAGYMGQRLTDRAAELDVGLCPIGGIDKGPLGRLLHLGPRMQILHSFEGGVPDRSRTAKLPTQAFIDELRRHMEVSLPAAMVPARFYVLRELPLSANGKIDRKKLVSEAGDATAETLVQPENELERVIVGLVASELSVGELGVETNFFHVGATSVHLVAVAAALSRHLGRPVPTMALFERPTVRQLARWLVEAGSDEDPTAQAKERGALRRGRRESRGR